MLLFLSLVLGALFGVWVYQDAQARAEPRPWFWGITTFLMAILVLPIWLLKRGPKRPPPGTVKTCAFCAEEINIAATVCKHCGREQVAA